MTVDRGWLAAEAASQGFSLSDEDLEAVGRILDTTRANLAGTRMDPPEWQDPPVGFLPPAGQPSRP